LEEPCPSKNTFLLALAEPPIYQNQRKDFCGVAGYSLDAVPAQPPN